MATTTITVNGEPIDVTECAQRNCGNHPTSDPKYRGIMTGGIFGGKRPDPSLKEEYRNKLRQYNTCLKSNCHPETGVEGSATPTGAPSRPASPNGSSGGSALGVGRATNDTPIVDPLPTQEESWFKRNQGIVYVGAGVGVLAIVGTIIYIVKKK